MSSGTLNKAIIIGRLGKDPELRYTQSGAAMASFSVATNESYKDKDGKTVDNTDWHRVVVWNKLAEICGQYLKKGSLVCVEGKIKTREYEDKEGVKRYVTEIKADSMQMLGGKPTGERDDIPPPEESSGEAKETANNDDDLPF